MSSPLTSCLKITAPNNPQAIEQELRQHMNQLDSLVFIPTERKLSSYSIIDDQDRVPLVSGAGANDDLYVIFIQYPYLLAAVTEQTLRDLRDKNGGCISLCHLMAKSYPGISTLQSATKRHKINHQKQFPSLLTLQTLFKQGEAGEEAYQTPFPHGTSLVQMAQVGKPTFTTICQCYQAWFSPLHTLDRLQLELSGLPFETYDRRELEVLCDFLYRAWQQSKEKLVER